MAALALENERHAAETLAVPTTEMLQFIDALENERHAAETLAVPTTEMLQFIEDTGDYDMKLDNEKEHQHIFNRLKAMLPLASLHPALKESLQQLLAVNDFTGNMSYMEIFDPLQQFCHDELLNLGAPLQHLYSNSEQIQSIGKIQTPTLAVGSGSLRQDHPLVGLSANTLDLSDFNGESVYIHFLRLLALLLNDCFQEKVLGLVAPLGGEHKGCAVKGDARMRNKALAVDDHRYEPVPRPAHNIDIVRCCVTCANVASLTSVIAAVAEGFSKGGKGGVGRIKNGFALTEAQAAQSFHYRSYMMNLVVDFGCTFGELLGRSESKEVLEKYVNAPPENAKEGWERWKSHARAAVEELQSAARAHQPVVMVCEVQVILRPYLEARKKMHLLYKVARADSAAHLAHQFARATPTVAVDSWETEQQKMAGMDLTTACFYGHVSAVSRLLALEGVKVNEANSKGDTGLCLASENGHSDVVTLLLDAEGMEVNKADGQGWTALHNAAAQGHVDIITLLLDAEGIDVNQARDNGETALLMASQAGYLDVVTLLLGAEGMDVNGEEASGTTALLVAAQEGQSEIVARLLGTEGLAVNHSDEEGATALYLASEGGHLAVVNLLLATGRMDVNHTTHDGVTALYQASQEGHLAVVRVLLQVEGIAINHVTDAGATALCIASDQGQSAVVHVLTEAGAQ